MISVRNIISREKYRERKTKQLMVKQEHLERRRGYLEAKAKEEKLKADIAKSKKAKREASPIFNLLNKQGNKAGRRVKKKVKPKLRKKTYYSGSPDFMGKGPDVGSSPGPDFQLGGKINL